MLGRRRSSCQPDMEEAGRQYGQSRVKVIKPREESKFIEMSSFKLVIRTS